MTVNQWAGRTIRRHTDDAYEDLGVIVHVDEPRGKYTWIPLPGRCRYGARKDRVRRKHHIKRPVVGYVSELREHLGSEAGQLSLVTPQPEGLRAYSVATLTDMAQDRNRRDRADIGRSLELMREQWGWIEPFVSHNPIEVVADPEAARAFANVRGETLRVDETRIVRAIRAYLIFGQRIEALLPGWDRCNQPGKEKLPRPDAEGNYASRAGRKNVGALNGCSEAIGPPLTAELRQILRIGWRKYKRDAASVEHAFHCMLAEFFPLSHRIEGEGARESVKVKLRPTSELPTIHQFRRHGPGRDPAMSATRINLGAHRYARNERPLHGTARDGLMAACQVAWIDSTPGDQNLVSAADPRVLMPQTFDTKIIEGYVGYIAGIYASFERPSTMTALLALHNAESDKVEFCRQYGVDIQSEDWLPLSFKRVRGDNGEAKSEMGINAMTSAQMTAEFVEAFAAERKGPVESKHNALARKAGHLIEGSSRGLRIERGDENPARNACQTFEAYMGALIRAILYHNNVERVEHLLTLEMRRDRVEPTRGSILKWLLREGYVASMSTDSHTLKTHCLPQLNGVIKRDGVWLFDPISRDERLIKNLRYSSPALHQTGLTDLGKNRRSTCRIHVDPSRIGKVWLVYQGLVELDLQTKDGEMANLTLREWLQIADADRLTSLLDLHKRLEVLASDGRSIYRSNAQARASKRAFIREAIAAGRGNEPLPNKQEAGNAAIEAARLERLGLAGHPQKPPSLIDAANDGGRMDFLTAARKRAARW